MTEREKEKKKKEQKKERKRKRERESQRTIDMKYRESGRERRGNCELVTLGMH